MDNKEEKNIKNLKKVFTRTEQDLQLKKQLLLSPNAFITDKGSDESLDRLYLKIKLIGGKEFTLAEYVSENMAQYEPKFYKDWFYTLADVYGVNRNVMDVYVKPDFVREFIVQFIYGRFPYMVLRTLRKIKLEMGEQNNKLFQYLTNDASQQLDIVIQQAYDVLSDSNSLLDFKMKYSKLYKVYYQPELF